MNCTSCGTPVPQGSGICSGCGRPVTAPQPTTGWHAEGTQPMPVRPQDTQPIRPDAAYGQQPYGQQPSYGQPGGYGQQPPQGYGRPGPVPPAGPNYFPPAGGGSGSGLPPVPPPPPGAPRRGPRTGLVVGIVAAMLLVVGGGATAAVVATRDSDPDPIADPVDPKNDPVEPMSDQDLAATWGPSVFRIEAEGCDATSSGTGWVVDDRHIVTNRHVVTIDGSPTVISRDGQELPGRVVGWSTDPDIAVIEVDGDLPDALDWATTADLTEGQHLVALGYPVPDLAFSVTPSSIVSFQSEGDTRQAIRADGALDRGNSGGPALTQTGQVAGVVTEMANNEDGFQLVPLLYTAEALSDVVEGFISSPSSVEPDCGSDVTELPEGWEDIFGGDPTDEPTGESWTYGDDPALDALQDGCTAGDMGACDDLYWQSPLHSDYEEYGATCGQRVEAVPGGCVDAFAESVPEVTPEVTPDDGGGQTTADLYQACADGFMPACDDLYWATPVGSPEEAFGSTCGGRSEPTYGSCS